MSISMRSTKKEMYSEIERLRAYCDQLEQQLRAAKPHRNSRPGKTNFALFAPDACKYFGKRSVTKEEIYDYINAMEAGASK